MRRSTCKMLRLFLLVSLTLTALELSPAPRAAHADGYFTVNTAADAPDANPGDGVCSTGAGGCSLRAAIQEASAIGAASVITFAAGLAGQTIALDASLGEIAWTGDDISLDGEDRNIAISGAGLAAGQSILHIQGDNCVVQNLSIASAPRDGIWLDNARNAEIAYNTLSGNQGRGIYVSGTDATGLKLRYNRIGVNSAGNAPMPNAQEGILIENVTNAQAWITNNVVSGNGAAGVWIKNSSVMTLSLNLIGVNLEGTAAIPNGQDGIAITDGASRVTVRDGVISGNARHGVRLSAGASNNRLETSLIGLNNNNAAIPNNGAGVVIENSSGAQIEASVKILNNKQHGVLLDNATGARIFAGLIANNGKAGVAVINDSRGNEIRPAEIRANGGLPIDLGDDGPTPNDPGDADAGPHDLINYPENVVNIGQQLLGAACPNCAVHLYQAIGNPGAPGGGATWLASTQAGASGNWDMVMPTGLKVSDITLQTHSAASGSSELRPRATRSVFLPAVFKNR